MDHVKHIEQHKDLHSEESLANNLSVVDDRIKYWLSLEMKKVSQMLIQNLTVFVQQATKLQMDQVVMPDLNKQNERLNSVEGKLENCIDSVEKLLKDQARLSAQFLQKS